MKFLQRLNPKQAYLALLVISLLLAVLFLGLLPANVPVQWGMDGAVNYTFPKQVAVLLLPALSVYWTFRGWRRPDLANLGWGLSCLVGVSGIFTFISVMY